MGEAFMEETIMFNNSTPFQTDMTSDDADDATNFVQTNLVSDIAGLAMVTDLNLVNPWGVSFNAATGSPFWISDQGSNLTTVYPVIGSTGIAPAVLTVHIPTTATGPQGPTGQVSNTNTSSFILSDGKSASFIFADLNGTISAWNPGPDPPGVNRVRRSDDARRHLYRIGSQPGSYDALRR
jgi:hypothetical protein